MDNIQRLVYIKCTLGACSLVGSFYIVQHVVRSPSRRQKTLPRIMVLMSSHDFLKALWDVVGHYVVPKDSIYGPFFPWIHGTWPVSVVVVVGGGGGVCVCCCVWMFPCTCTTVLWWHAWHEIICLVFSYSTVSSVFTAPLTCSHVSGLDFWYRVPCWRVSCTTECWLSIFLWQFGTGGQNTNVDNGLVQHWPRPWSLDGVQPFRAYRSISTIPPR